MISGRGRKDIQKRETESIYPKRGREQGGQSFQEMSALKEGVIHSAECFTEVKIDKDMDLTK